MLIKRQKLSKWIFKTCFLKETYSSIILYLKTDQVENKRSEKMYHEKSTQKNPGLLSERFLSKK